MYSNTERHRWPLRHFYWTYIEPTRLFQLEISICQRGIWNSSGDERLSAWALRVGNHHQEVSIISFKLNLNKLFSVPLPKFSSRNFAFLSESQMSEWPSWFAQDCSSFSTKNPRRTIIPKDTWRLVKLSLWVYISLPGPRHSRDQAEMMLLWFLSVNWRKLRSYLFFLSPR